MVVRAYPANTPSTSATCSKERGWSARTAGNACARASASTGTAWPSRPTSSKIRGPSASEANRIAGVLAGKISSVVLVRPAHYSDQDERYCVQRDPVAHSQPQEGQCGSSCKEDGPPAPRAVEADFRVSVVNFCIQTVFWQFTTETRKSADRKST